MLRSDGALGSSTARQAARVAAALLVAVHVAGAQTPARPDSTGSITGLVVVRDGGVPLPYSVVAVPSLNRERFSNDRGVFTLSDLPAGPLVVRVRHIGYSPVEVTVNVHAGGLDSVRIQLSHIVVRLSAMEVRAYPECKNPGIPHGPADSAFAVLFDQLHLNADQYRMLTETYPFRYSAERTRTHTLVNGDVRMDEVDTVEHDSRVTWRYKPGGVISLGDGPPGFRPPLLNIPTLANFADQTFLDNHCFMNGGSETIDGTDLLRIDFTASSRINDPDVNGSMYLDATTFQIRRSVIRLTRVPKNVPNLRETQATTWFTDALSSISMIAGVSSISRLNVNRGRPAATDALYEEQRLIRVEFLRALPGGEVKKP